MEVRHDGSHRLTSDDGVEAVVGWVGRRQRQGD